MIDARWLAPLVLCLASPAAAADTDEAQPSPFAGFGVAGKAAPYTDEERQELDGVVEALKGFEQESTDYRQETRALIEHQYKEKRNGLFNAFESRIVDLEKEQRLRRDRAIASFESFLAKYPGDDRYTPDAMFRLSELYFERSYDTYFQARQAYEKAMETYDPQGRAPEPVEPSYHYEPTIAMMQRLITEFPDYRLIDGAYYLLGFCLGEQGEEERAVEVYQELLARRPQSKFAAEVWTRIGEYYFNTNELSRALDAYSQVLPFVDSPFYDKALYKLAWTHYRLADPERAPQEFQNAVDIFVKLLDFNEQSRAAGSERGGDLRAESVQYIAISYADEQWGGTDKLVAYLDGLGERPYAREVLAALGDVYFDQTRFADSLRTLKIVQERFPDHPEAPVVQEKIITADERNRDFEAAASERELMTTSYSQGSRWYEANKENHAALERADKLTQASLYSAALFHHKQAQIHKDASKIDLAKEEYGKAAKAYGAYLQRFPHDRQLYELTYYYADCLYYSLQFDEAAERYKEVRDSKADTKFLDESAFSVILAYENAVKMAEARGELAAVKVQKSNERAPDEAIAAKEIPQKKLAVVAASDRYAELFPKNERVPKVLYKAAEIFYTYDNFDEARRRFKLLLDNYPQNEVAEYAANLIIESHLSEKNYAAVESFSRQVLTMAKVPGRKEFKGELIKFKTGAMFKLAEDLDKQGEHEPAAELYLKMIDENPQSQFADSALNNAAVDYEKVKRYDSASKLYERLVKEHPKSPLADTALFRVGLNAERFFDFDKAIAAYTTLVARYPKSDRCADAIYNSALSLENTQEYDRAATQYLRYCDLFKTREDAPQVCFRAGLVYEKMGEPRRVISTYQAFVQKYRKNPATEDRVVEAYMRMAQAYEKLKDEKQARSTYEQAVAEFKRTGNAKAGPYAAESQFQLVERDFAKFKEIGITGSSKEQKKALTHKAEVLKSVEDRYKSVLPFKQIEWTLAALFRIGQLYQNFADSLTKAPCPPDVRQAARSMGVTAEEVCDEYRVILEEKAAGIEDKAVVAFETTINKAREFQVANRWTKLTLIALNRLRAKMWPLQKDAKQFIDVVALRPPSMLDEMGRPVVKPAPPSEAPPAEKAKEPEPAKQAPSPPHAGAPAAAEPPAASPAPAVSPTPLAPPEPPGLAVPPPPPEPPDLVVPPAPPPRPTSGP
jgi:cellulose synthase operon protein C